MYYMAFMKYLLEDVKDVDMTLHKNCNAGVTATKTKEDWGKFHMWVNQNGSYFAIYSVSRRS